MHLTLHERHICRDTPLDIYEQHICRDHTFVVGKEGFDVGVLREDEERRVCRDDTFLI